MSESAVPICDLPTLIHTAESGLRQPKQFVQRLASDLRRCQHIGWEMFRRDMTSQYRQSMFGVLLSLVPAIMATAGAIAFEKAKLINVGDVAISYPMFVLCGTMLWTTFTEALSGPIDGLIAEQSLLSRANIPPEAVVLARLGQVLFNLMVKVLILAVAAAGYRMHIPWTLVLAPIGLILLVCFGTAIGLIFAPLNLLYRDVSRGVGVLTSVWFFLTPIVYTPSAHGWLATIIRLNPVTPLLVTTRDLAFRGLISMPIGFAVSGVSALVLLAFGIVCHRIALPVVIDRANA